MNKTKRRWKGQGEGVYLDTFSNRYYHRPVINGKSTFRLLDVRTLTEARALKARLDSSQTLHANGLEKDPYGAAPMTVGELIEGYRAKDCPLKNHQPRQGTQLDQELSRLQFLENYWKHRRADQIKPKDCFGYFEARKETLRKGYSGGRAVDMELATLAGVLRWATFHGKLDSNPLAQRPAFRDRKKVKHCRNFMPQTIDELHNLARALFEDPRSESLGWQLLLEALTGCRTSEILALRWDAKNPAQPGFIDRSHLWLNRCKGGINPYVEIHPALADALDALKRWRVSREMTETPWFIPSHRNPGHAVEKQSLTHALKRIAKLICGEHRTSHGLRAFYVTVRRSLGISDGQIAAEIGDVSGAPIIISTYGAIPPNWAGRAGLSWTPQEPAWSVLDLPANVIELAAVV